MSEDHEGTSTKRALKSALAALPSPSSIGVSIVAVIGAVIVIGLIVVVSSSYFARTTVTTVVQDKERVCDTNSEGNRSCKYLVYTDDGTYKLTDSLVIGRFNTSDIYGRVKRCHTYEIESYGWRLGLTSSYPNITEMNDLGRKDGCES